MKKILNYIYLFILNSTFLFSMNIIFNNNSSFLNKKLNSSAFQDRFNYNKVEYEITNINMELVTDLVSQSGNTKYKPIIKTRFKDLEESSSVTLKIIINSNLIDLKNSYFDQGTIDKDNNFIVNGEHIKLIEKTFFIKNPGIYCLHLISNSGNGYESYLELGFQNWKISDNFNDNELADSATELNVKIAELDKMTTEKKIKLSEWLNNYKFSVNQKFLSVLQDYNKGFDINMDDFKNRYQDLLNHVDYAENKKINIDSKKIIESISDVAMDKLKSALNQSETNINMHGYSLEQVLNGNQLPDTKQKIVNYDHQKSFSQWLQDQANAKFYFWLWTIKISSSSVILFLLILTITVYLYIRYRRIYQPVTLKKINFSQQQKYTIQEEKIILKVAQFIKLNQKNNFWNKDRLNSYCFIKEMVSNNLDNIEYNKYDNIYYHKTNKTYLLGKEFIRIFLNSNDIYEYNKVLKSFYPNCDKGRLHRTMLYDILIFYLNRAHHSEILKLEKDFDNNIKMDLATIRRYLKNQEWSYYFYDLQNITHKSIIRFLNWQNKPLNYSAYGKVLKRKLYWLLQSEEEVEAYLAIVQNINLYRNILCKASPLKHDKFTEWKQLTVEGRTDLAWNMYLDLTKLIAFINQNLS